ncbi:MAG TPA: hypothetical protein VHE83_00160 [Mycobacteriales bacterium]|nr:hypothetical protein [Mycobacteriales bacterium]
MSSGDLLEDYRGAYEPGLHLGRLSRDLLARLGREWLLHGHLMDRIGVPMVLQHGTKEDAEQIAIEEWMSASPVYSRRMQRAMGFTGTTVDTILKNLQLDIGAPHQFLDFRLRLIDDDHAEFHLPYCGALMDVEPMGEEWVRGMCHRIEDPTFDATATASNPHAQMRPIHRPPRVPADRAPHCQWRIDIVPEAPAAQAHPNEELVAASLAARLPTEVADAEVEDGGWADYSGAFDSDFELEDLTHGAQQVVLKEVALQSHLLLRGFLTSMGQRLGEEHAAAAAPRILVGLAGLTAQRLRDALGITETNARGIAKVLQLHPAFYPRDYIGIDVRLVDDATVRVAFPDAPIWAESVPKTWAAALSDDGARVLATVARAIDPTADCEATEPDTGERLAFTIRTAVLAEPAAEPIELALAKISKGASFALLRRREVRV